MDKSRLIQQLLSNIEDVPLSKSVPSVLSLALECKDFEGYCVISLLMNPISENQTINAIQTDEIIKVLILQGLSSEDIAKTIEKGRESVIGIKTITEDQVSSHSIKEIETWLLEAETILSTATNIPREKYEKLSVRLNQTRSLYESMRCYTISKLTYYQQIVKKQGCDNMKKERRHSFTTNKVFIVHGHDTEKKEAVARLIERQGIQAIILHEQANQGDTIIEKFERNSDVGCAICLFTADDIGRAKTDTDDCARARQNVVFEAGYFMGKLGRNKVIVVADRGVEIPSDLQGVVYTDSSDWRLGVLKELKAREYNIDYSKL